jgi:hypothetical protein
MVKYPKSHRFGGRIWNHPTSGASLAEATAAICILIPFLLIALDGAVFFAAITMNDNACKEACRAASMGAPDAIKKGEPRKNALAALQQVQSSTNLVQISPKLEVTEKLQPPIPGTPFGGPVHGEVTVGTNAEVSLPFITKLLRRGPTTVSAKRTYAYTWVMPSDVAN